MNSNIGYNQSSRMSVEPRESVSSCHSLVDRLSWGSVHQNQKNSLKEVMSLEGSGRIDFVESILHGRQSENQFFQGRILDEENQNLSEVEGFDYDYQITSLERRKSDENSIIHTCLCYQHCQWQICPCLQAVNQPCLAGFCCSQCVAQKAIKLAASAPKVVAVSCTCKKTKCNKKYCSCFAAGVMCGKECSCQGCINCLRESEQIMEEEREDIPLEVLAQMDMPEAMDFEPIEFRYSNV